jgi:hypothetical protein
MLYHDFTAFPEKQLVLTGSRANRMTLEEMIKRRGTMAAGFFNGG